MLELDDVTLVMIETMDHELARLAVQDCVTKAKFAEVLICTDKPELFDPLDCDAKFERVENWPDKIGWSRYSWFGAPPLVRTRQMLYIQWDGFIWHPEMWRDEFMRYDYIGAPWWHRDGLNVGNGGFSLRSTEMMRYIGEHSDRFPCTTNADDALLCRDYRPALEDAGFIWSPESTARQFAFECERPTSRTFGFHALFNFPFVLEHETLMARLRIARRSPYIVNGRMWQALTALHPNLEIA
jgi:hypothetical protein